MEPRTLQNLNGTISVASTPRSLSANNSQSPTKEFLNLSTPGTDLETNRRKSTLWTRNLEASPDDEDEYGPMILSPVPATPAPEVISAYAENILGDGNSPNGIATPYFLKKDELMMRTCPPKQAGDEGILGSNGDENSNGSGRLLMQRLMLARRKSLQWAPKIGSPLAKGFSDA